MFEQTREDSIKSRIAQELGPTKEYPELSDYLREYNRRYEEEKYKEDNTLLTEETEEPKERRLYRVIRFVFKHYPFKRLHRDSLEAKLLDISHEYAISDEQKRRALDKKAYKTIMWCRDCRKDREIRRYYYLDFYRPLKEYCCSQYDLSQGIYYIDHQLEDFEEP